jgi:ubiquinone/menaquinone biosynthesis C-methylase UbiE
MTVGRQADAALAIELARLDPGDHVVDLGCGPGTAARRAARTGARVTGIDPAPVMLRVARALGRGTRVKYEAGAAEAIPVPNGSATVVWTLASVHHWPDVASGIAEVQRVLRPGGRFVTIEHQAEPGATGHRSHGWTGVQAESFASAVRDGGFSDVRVVRSNAGRRPAVAVVAVKR